MLFQKINIIYKILFSFFLIYALYSKNCDLQIRLGEPFSLVVEKPLSQYSLQRDKIESSGFDVLEIRENEKIIEIKLVSFQIDSIQCFNLSLQDSFLRPVYSKEICFCFQSSLNQSDSLRFIQVLRVNTDLGSESDNIFWIAGMIVISVIVILLFVFHKKLFYIYEKWRLKRRYTKLIQHVMTFPLISPSSLFVKKLNQVWKDVMKVDFQIGVGSMTYEELKSGVLDSFSFQSDIIQLILDLIKKEIDICFYHKPLIKEDEVYLKNQIKLLLMHMYEFQLGKIRGKYGF